MLEGSRPSQSCAIFEHRDSEGEKKHLRSQVGTGDGRYYAGRVTHSNRVVFSPGPRLRVNPPLRIGRSCRGKFSDGAGLLCEQRLQHIVQNMPEKHFIFLTLN
ncbi:hypothetical protein L798_04897 [Zootermopsis nevadensis]|uniref:Uncharacterized protein n=1 Tax=Zootermopsis nevadensis TaxID=136037 RepID=A0A067R9Y7_ZOONE|nr:hypothetical protein L798_04897 [Zootermopsis nevadensis]